MDDNCNVINKFEYHTLSVKESSCQKKSDKFAHLNCNGINENKTYDNYSAVTQHTPAKLPVIMNNGEIESSDCKLISKQVDNIHNDKRKNNLQRKSDQNTTFGINNRVSNSVNCVNINELEKQIDLDVKLNKKEDQNNSDFSNLKDCSFKKNLKNNFKTNEKNSLKNKKNFKNLYNNRIEFNSNSFHLINKQNKEVNLNVNTEKIIKKNSKQTAKSNKSCTSESSDCVFLSASNLLDIKKNSLENNKQIIIKKQVKKQNQNIRSKANKNELTSRTVSPLNSVDLSILNASDKEENPDSAFVDGGQLNYKLFNNKLKKKTNQENKKGRTEEKELEKNKRKDKNEDKKEKEKEIKEEKSEEEEEEVEEELEEEDEEEEEEEEEQQEKGEDEEDKLNIKEENSWDCSVCTFRNHQDAFKCLMCDVRKGMSTRKPRVNPQLLAQQVARQQQQIQQQALKASAKQAEKEANKDKGRSSQGQTNSHSGPVEKRKTIDQEPMSPSSSTSSAKSVKREKKNTLDKEEILDQDAKVGESSIKFKSLDRDHCITKSVTVNNVTVMITEFQVKNENNVSDNSVLNKDKSSNKKVNSKFKG